MLLRVLLNVLFIFSCWELHPYTNRYFIQISHERRTQHIQTKSSNGTIPHNATWPAIESSPWQPSPLLALRKVTEFQPPVTLCAGPDSISSIQTPQFIIRFLPLSPVDILAHFTNGEPFWEFTTLQKWFGIYMAWRVILWCIISIFCLPPGWQIPQEYHLDRILHLIHWL